MLAVRCGWPLTMSSAAASLACCSALGQIAGGDRDLGDHVEGVDDLHAGARVMPGQALEQLGPLGVDLMGLAQPAAGVERADDGVERAADQHRDRRSAGRRRAPWSPASGRARSSRPARSRPRRRPGARPRPGRLAGQRADRLVEHRLEPVVRDLGGNSAANRSAIVTAYPRSGGPAARSPAASARSPTRAAGQRPAGRARRPSRRRPPCAGRTRPRRRSAAAPQRPVVLARLVHEPPRVGKMPERAGEPVAELPGARGCVPRRGRGCAARPQSHRRPCRRPAATAGRTRSRLRGRRRLCTAQRRWASRIAVSSSLSASRSSA